MLLNPPSHVCTFANWELMSSDAGVFGTNKVERRSCMACGASETRVTEMGVFGPEVRVSRHGAGGACVEKAPVQVKEVKVTLTTNEMVEALKKEGFQVAENIIVSPLELPEGQMMVDKVQWDKVQDIWRFLERKAARATVAAISFGVLGGIGWLALGIHCLTCHVR